MINHVSNVNKTAFAPLQSSGATFAITKPFTKEQKEEVIVEKEKKNNALGYSIAITALVTGLGVFMVTKGLPRKARHKINKFFRYLEDKTTKLNKNSQKNSLQVMSLKALKGIKSLTKYSKVLFNSAPLKDAAVTHIIEKSEKAKKWSNKITDIFEKISVKTSKRAYSKTLLKFDGMYADFAAVNAKLKEKGVSQSEIDTINKKISSVRNKYHSAFGEAARNERLIEVKKDMNGIDKEIYKKTWGDSRKYFTDPNTLTTFISEEVAAPSKMKLANKVNKLREEISISPDDNYMATKKLMSTIYDFVDPKEITARELMGNLSKDLKNYKKALDGGAKAEDVFPKDKIGKNLKDLETYFKNSNDYNTKTKEQVLENIKDLNSALTGDSVLKANKGEIQEIMDIYEKHLSKDDYAKLNKSVNKSLKSLNRSIDMETDKLFDKIRDLLIGAAPVDILGVLSSVGIVGWGLTKADNNDERISAALKFGIPAVGGVLISLVCTVGLVAGGPSLVIGLVSSALINKLGVFADNTRKKYKEEPPTLTIPDPVKFMEDMKEKAISVKNKPALQPTDKTSR